MTCYKGVTVKAIIHNVSIKYTDKVSLFFVEKKTFISKLFSRLRGGLGENQKKCLKKSY
jgi:hypothetical protein